MSDIAFYIQGWAKEWSLGCVNSRPAARESLEAGFTQPRAHLIAHMCTGFHSSNNFLARLAVGLDLGAIARQGRFIAVP